MAIRKYVMWALHEKVGKQPWKFATWFTPRFDSDYTGDEVSAEQYVKNTAKGMTDRLHKYKAVQYVPKGRNKCPK
jgi:hypothetical protein